MDIRRHKIVELINLHGEMSFTALKEHFPEVSEVTLRKDLRHLDSEQLIVRIHGGAKSLPTAIGAVDNFYTRSTRHTDEKVSIAQKALSLLRPHQAIFIGSGSTCAELCKNLTDIPLQVFTDGLMTALELSKQSNVEVTILGGEVNTNDVRASGPRVFNELNQLHFDLAFLGTDGYRINQGFGCYSPHSAALFNALRKCSDTLVVLMDHSKINAARAARNIPADYINYVISDDQLDHTVIKSLTQAGVTVL